MKQARVKTEMKNYCLFFHRLVVFLLTLAAHESIHSSTAVTNCREYKIVTRENRQMATKKAAKKAPAKKAAKKAAKKK
jgi:hypothetical protein